MVDLDELLKTSLGLANDRFKAANSDLLDIVEKAGASLKRTTNSRIGLGLVRSFETSTGVVFRVDLVEGLKHLDDVAWIKIPRGGYPLQSGWSFVNRREGSDDLKDESARDEYHFGFEASGVIKDKSALEEYFVTLFANPDSTLVLKTAYFLQRQPAA